MSRTLNVSLGGVDIGTLTNLPGDYNVFSFDTAYLENPDRPVLSQSFIDVNGDPIRIVPRTHTVAPPFFANLLPERDTLLRSIVARQQGIKPAPDFAFLQALGRDLPGAVVLRDSGGADSSPKGDGEPDGAEEPIQFSLAGMQLKFSTSMFNERFHVTQQARGESWIVKLPTNAYARLPENEFAVMTLASRIGLNVPPIELRDLGSVVNLPAALPALRADEPPVVYAIRRFDRLAAGSRLHVEDFNQIAAQQPDEKYDNKSSSYVASVISQLCSPDDVDEFVRRLVFGICIGNNDMHLKNWALAYPGGRNAVLAPMYDFVCTHMYFPAGKLALTVGGERMSEQITTEVIARFAAQAQISTKRAKVLAKETAEKIRYAWPPLREELSDRAFVDAIDDQFARVPLMRP
jgi:serine/threonine-protein kinase HipA